MKINLRNDADVFAVGQIAGLQNPRSVAALVAAYAETKCPKEEDLEVVISKSLLSDSYKSNPSVLGIKILGKLDGDFNDSAGHQTPNDPKSITVVLMRENKPTYTNRRYQAVPSVKQSIKNWLHLNLPKHNRLMIPIISMPAFYLTHPEQLTYQIRKETETPIKIKRLKKNFMISRE